MSKRLDALLTRMPSHFAKSEDSNNYKLLSLIAEGSEETRAVYNAMLKFWDVDQSEGIGLDRLGKDEGISRGGMDDDEYRKMIKIQCILNMSDGDIPTMNLILDAYMGESFIGVQDAFHEIGLHATILGNVKQFVGALPNELIKRLKPAGVSFKWLSRFEEQQLTLTHHTYSYPVLYPIAGYHWTEGIKGTAFETNVSVDSEPFHYPVLYPMASEHVLDGIKGEQMNDSVAGIVHNVATIINPYPVCGEFFGGGF